ncbi:phage integrase [Yersinia pestis PY-66]|uniref:Uncharacterized protein n=2 Tax=Yersinia pseudotuberculosis complex TaxID=1649845 RepID=A0A0U1R216_YERP3|nr:hypothetical protein YpsIP31758_3009 [Yersinia pseudotuberculosis IP 31758]ABX86569.1 hypothetical protein YpAngola_A1285 [Yersinia pestis Angola]EDR39412.1 hypothetical protein YpF1991016_3680 [Yersinia pestis biovar Orientalis str. F1991016]EDR44860.1 hypothetical protein YpE1979001_1378 [Yersinia pestis biovar Antiqua str. E1979001]EDR48965.1 hypothetical protein YpB42003004_3254 [Yersinia pestis biovar Antiqua str. B42003004]EDR56722.1 hypothetical protein YpMG051020_4554 [Yersinia pest
MPVITGPERQSQKMGVCSSKRKHVTQREKISRSEESAR